jgi:hypothetical protein
VGSATLEFAPGVLPAIPLGATIYRSPTCPFGVGTADVIATYQYGLDYIFDSQEGQILYVKPFPPFDGTEVLIPAPMQCKPLPAGATLSCEVTLNNALMAPEKIPALYGGTTDDDGEVRFPILSPSPACELGLGYVSADPGLVQAVRNATAAEVTRTATHKRGTDQRPQAVRPRQDPHRLQCQLDVPPLP